MFPITLMDGHTCWINPDHILMLEARPDTLIRLINGEKWLVKESIETLQERFYAHKRRCFEATVLPADSDAHA